MKSYNLYRKACALILALTLICGLTVNAAASDKLPDADEQPTDDVAVSDEMDTDESTVTAQEAGFVYKDESESSLNTLTTHANNAYLYWVTQVLDPNPTLHYDASMKQYYLAFSLSTSSKLAMLIDSYHPAFRLERNLATLQKQNDLNTAIWDKETSMYEQTIGERLSKETAAKVGLDSGLDAYHALLLIQQSPDYKKNDLFRVQVDYSLHCITSIAEEVAEGMSQITEFRRVPATALYESSIPMDYDDMTPSELCDAVKQFLGEHPEWKVMSETYEIAMNGTTSKYLTTFEALDQDKLEDLYKRTTDVAVRYWPYVLKELESPCFAVPFPVGTVFQWSDGMKDTAEAIENNLLPISATGE